MTDPVDATEYLVLELALVDADTPMTPRMKFACALGRVGDELGVELRVLDLVFGVEDGCVEPFTDLMNAVIIALCHPNAEEAS